jgi:hypothetical protein
MTSNAYHGNTWWWKDCYSFFFDSGKNPKYFLLPMVPFTFAFDLYGEIGTVGHEAP